MAKLNQAMSDLNRYNAAILPRKRSFFDKSHSHVTCIDSAYLVPIMWDRVVPGDEKKIRYSGLARMATPIHPVMDEAFLDTWCFYIPDRLWYKHAKEFYGENLDADFNPDGEYVMPSLKPSQYGVRDTSTPDDVGLGSLNDYFGFPKLALSVVQPHDDDMSLRCTAGLHRSYQLIWNEWFRNSSVQPALRLNDGDTVTDEEWGVIKKIRKVCKLPDNFTCLLKTPQAGEDVLLPLGEWAPVVTRPVNNDVNGMESLRFAINDSDSVPNYLTGVNDLKLSASVLSAGDNTVADSYGRSVVPSNLWTDLTSATSTTINNLRSAITIQQLLEVSAIGGKRYQGQILAHFGTFVPDGTLQRPLLCGSTRTSIGMRQVLQTSSTDGTSPQGNAAAVSVTNVTNEWICNQSFTEPGFIMVLAAVRPLHSYSQGINPLLRKINPYDHYYPVFDNLGNQPVYTSEIFAWANTADDFKSRFDTVFGYKEAWQEYRFMSNRCSSLMRPDVSGTLASWNYSSKFTSAPVLNEQFMEEDPTLIDRTIAVQSEPQFLLDNYFEYHDIKNMSVKSVPGLKRL